MANAKILFPFILKWEGGFVNDPADSGGATNMGVTLATYEAYCRKKGYPKPTVERLKNITREQVFDIFKTMFWDKWHADEINDQRVANMLVDWIWASGIRGITNPQRVLGVKSDGIVGNKTITAVNFAEPGDLFQALWNCRKQFLLNITNASVAAYTKRIGRTPTESELLKHTKKRFINGWLNRLEKIKEL